MYTRDKSGFELNLVCASQDDKNCTPHAAKMLCCYGNCLSNNNETNSAFFALRSPNISDIRTECTLVGFSPTTKPFMARL